MEIIALLHMSVTVAMTGLIWFVQIVHYPLFRLVGADGAHTYQAAHEPRTGLVVVPLMLVETATAVLLALRVPDGVSATLTVTGIVLLAIIWWSTFFLQVPQHRVLRGGADELAYRRLVRTNWLRTAGWTLRSLVAALILYEMLQGS